MKLFKPLDRTNSIHSRNVQTEVMISEKKESISPKHCPCGSRYIRNHSALLL